MSLRSEPSAFEAEMNAYCGDLVLRISGFSAYFNTLAETVRDEIIARTETELSR